MGQYERSIVDFSLSLEYDPGFTNALQWRGRVYLKTEQFEKAIEDFSAIVRQDEADFMTYYGRGLASMKLGQLEGAVKDFDRAIRMNRKHAPSYNVRGLAQYVLGDYDQAIYDFTQAIKLRYNSPEVFYNRGRALYMQGLPELALDDFQEAIRIRPSHTLAYLFLVHTRIVTGKAGNDEEIIALKRSVGLDAHPEHNTVLLKVSEQYLERNNAREACRWAEEARNVLPPKVAGEIHNREIRETVQIACKTEP
ncbi:MAG: tetratricopeptide repeat protein [candidate division Zixibacteria bacterium]|nr:tetratricopeptide repeat protein [candidate division Zixibacteria bacterium]NIU16051.1 tetratricopeptide repeat protein [candidate division Zixibacteria bacterium]